MMIAAVLMLTTEITGCVTDPRAPGNAQAVESVRDLQRVARNNVAAGWLEGLMVAHSGVHVGEIFAITDGEFLMDIRN